MTNRVIYPLDRLLANPLIFHAIANRLGGPDGETLKSATYDLLEYGMEASGDLSECEFEADEVCFQCEDEDGRCEIILDNGLMSVLEAVEGEIRAAITTDGEFAASSAIYSRLVDAINESHPELKGDIALCSPPTPGNSFLRSDDGDRFEGEFHLLSDPEKTYSFSVEIIDINSNELKATINPL